MKRPPCWPLLLFSLLPLTGPGHAQTRPAPLYTLPADGIWVEYEWVRTLPSGKQVKGTLRISSVGRKDVERVPYRWVEIQLSTRRGDKVLSRYRKLLVEEKALARGGTFNDAVRQCFDKSDPEGAVTRLPPGRLLDFLGMGLREGAALRERAASEEVQTKLGKFAARHVTTATESGPGSRDYHGWLTDRVPFGWAKFEIHEKAEKAPSRRVFRVVAVRTGDGARSQLDETKAK